MPESAAVKLEKAALIFLAILVVTGLCLSLGPPRVLWLNAGLRIEYEWKRGTAALLAAAGAAGLSVALRKTALRVLGAVAAVALAAFGADRFAYRVEAVEDGLWARTLLGTTSLPWASITRVDATPDGMTATSDRGTMRVGTASLAPDQRAALERTVARRVREAGDRREPRPAGGEGPPGSEPPR